MSSSAARLFAGSPRRSAGPSRTSGPSIRRALATSGAILAIAGTAAACGGVGGVSSAQLYQLRMCESGGNYGINTGNGYYGAYQFSLETWRSLGFGGYPNAASPGTQDAAVAKLHAQSGWRSWPVCGRGL
jgi:hypothetical protein